MIKAKLTRVISTKQGTKGTFQLNGLAPLLFSMENPWRDNVKVESCIPCGVYQCELVNSPRFGPSYMVKDVPGRSHILFHAGNSPDDTDGCILLGKSADMDVPAMWVGNSKPAMQHFRDTLQGEPFELTIEDAV